MNVPLRGPTRARVRLWMKLAAFAAAGVVTMHAMHLFIGNRVATRALAAESARLGRDVARLVAQRAADPLLVDDLLSLEELVQGAAEEGSRVSYCLIVRDGVSVASSFDGPVPPGLLSLREEGDSAPVVVRAGDVRVLDLVEPILGGRLGHVQLGLDMRILDETRENLAVRLGVLALVMIALGLAAAFLAGREVARPIGEMLAAAEQFDPRSGVVPEIQPRGSDEVAVLAGRFDQMMRRLGAAHQEQARARQKAVETERLAAMGSLVAGVAHEVNNPLAGLKNCVRRLERQDLPDAKRLEYLALMEEGLVRIEEVVRQLLDFGRPHPPRLEPVPASLIAGEAVALVRPALERRDVSIRVVCEGDERANADRRLVEQALLNLVLNAAYVTPDRGEIRVRIRTRERLVGIAVEDDGPGIPEDIRERILDPFFSTKPEGDGTGLGLSVTRTIAGAHGGELTFEFPVGGGTVATLWIPRAPPAERATA
jgi:two-component system, NtrC family, sensor kinase